MKSMNARRDGRCNNQVHEIAVFPFSLALISTAILLLFTVRIVSSKMKLEVPREEKTAEGNILSP